MSEIKSTLDLVMERTKNLTMSDDEKEKQREADLKKRLAGLVQKYQDRTIRTTELFQRLDELKNTFGPGAEKRMAQEILNNVEVESDSNDPLTLLKEYFGLEIAPLEKILADYSQALQDLQNERLDLLKSQLSNGYRISGTAVVPNIEADPDWPTKRTTITERFRIQLETEKKRSADHLNP